MITFTATVADPGTLSLAGHVPERQVRRVRVGTQMQEGPLRLARKCLPAKIVFAKGSKPSAAAGTVTFTLKPSASALKALKKRAQAEAGECRSRSSSVQVLARRQRRRTRADGHRQAEEVAARRLPSGVLINWASMSAEDDTRTEEAELEELPTADLRGRRRRGRARAGRAGAAELDPETRARRDAALRHVRKLGDPVLRAKALPVERFDERCSRRSSGWAS